MTRQYTVSREKKQRRNRETNMFVLDLVGVRFDNYRQRTALMILSILEINKGSVLIPGQRKRGIEKTHRRFTDNYCFVYCIMQQIKSIVQDLVNMICQ